MNSNINDKERNNILEALRCGVVPRTGLQHIQVGRMEEIRALNADFESLCAGRACFRIVIGPYGAGKSFFMALTRNIARHKKIVVTHADLAPDSKRLNGTGGKVRALYSELVRNLSTRSKEDGNSLESIIQVFIYNSEMEAQEFCLPTIEVVKKNLSPLKHMTGGYDFADVILMYYKGYSTENTELKENSIRWLRGEYRTKGEAKKALGVASIVEDSSVYDTLKLLAKFTRIANYNGLIICLDEMVNLYKMTHSKSRNENYEQILRILNDLLQTNVEGLGFIMGGTLEFLEDPLRGLYSYKALQDRLLQNRFMLGGKNDFSGPVIKLDKLSNEDFFLLLGKINEVYSSKGHEAAKLPEEALSKFLGFCLKSIGSETFANPRRTITTFINFLSAVEQNPSGGWKEILQEVCVVADDGAAAKDLEVDVFSDEDQIQFQM